MKLTAWGSLIIILAIVSNIIANRVFGENIFPKTPEEVISDWLCLITIALGIIINTMAKKKD